MPRRERGLLDMTLEGVAQFLNQKGICGRWSGPGETRLRSATHDSRRSEPGTLFCCVPGGHRDGHDFAPQAVAAGASALLVERELPLPVPQLIVPQVSDALGYAAAAVYGVPADRLKMIAVTGTNGKSSTTYLLRSILACAGIPCGLLGTIVYHDGLEEYEADRTTPQAPDVQYWLHRMVSSGCKACVLEASSHGLVQGRLKGCSFDGAIFTNLTPEHLDYHGTMEEYFESKKALFDNYTNPSWCGAINRDDPYGRRLLDVYGDRCLGYSLNPSSSGDCFPEDVAMDIKGGRFSLNLPGVPPLAAELPLAGHFLLANALGAASLAFRLRVAPEAIVEGLRRVPQVPGRMERYATDRGVACVIDYAHSPDALDNVLRALRSLCRGKLWVVFGSGGERFSGNRPVMGEVAAQWGDRVIITMDNPRGEDPAAIAAENFAGVRRAGGEDRCSIVLNRHEAVWHAMDRAEEGDVVLVAGKGPERFILRGGDKIPYTDKGAFLSWASARGVAWHP